MLYIVGGMHYIQKNQVTDRVSALDCLGSFSRKPILPALQYNSKCDFICGARFSYRFLQEVVPMKTICIKV